MKILVCINKTPDTTSRIAFKANNTQFDDAGIQWILNPYDEWFALVRAIELKEKNPDTIIHLVTVGGSDCDPIIRKALALGGDEAFRINLEANDSFSIAEQIATLVQQQQYDLIFTGKESIDYNSAAIGGMIAELSDLPFVSFATLFEIEGSSVTVTREIEGGEEIVETALPLVVSCQKGMAEQRIPNMRGIMAARTKPLTVLEPSASEPLTDIVNYELPPSKAGCKMVSSDNVAELIRLLHEEAKVF